MMSLHDIVIAAKIAAKQASAALVVDAQVTENSSNPVMSSGIYSFVNSSVATNTAFFIGTFGSVSDLEAYAGAVTNNDYAFAVSAYTLLLTQPADWAENYTSYFTKSVTAPTWVADKYYEKNGDEYTVTTAQPDNWATNYGDYYTVFNETSYHSVVGIDIFSAVTGGSAPTFAANTYYASGTTFNRYKYNSNTDQWEYEYTLNNSSYTAAQWAAINSGMSAVDKTKLDGIEDGATKTIIDSALSDSSTNPVQNAVITNAMTPMTQQEYDDIQTKDLPLYFIYET